jgi:hypothetical protein
VSEDDQPLIRNKLKRMKKPKALAIAAALFAAGAIQLQGQLLQPVSSPPRFGTYYSMQLTNYPPLPELPFNVPVFLMSPDGIFCYDDRQIDYQALERARQQARAERLAHNSTNDLPPIPGGDDGTGDDPGVPPPHTKSYGPHDLYLELLPDQTVGFLDPVLHGTTNGFYELFEKSDLSPSLNISNWIPTEIVQDFDGTNELIFSAVPDTVEQQRFFRAVGGNTILSITVDRNFPNAVEPCSDGASNVVGAFQVAITPTLPYDLTVVYNVTGSATPGSDYTTLTGTVIISNGMSFADIYVQPLYDSNIDFEESVVITPVLTNGYLLDPDRYSATIWITECTNYFQIVATNVPSPSGIDYHPPSQQLLLGVYLDNNGRPYNFAMLNTNHALTQWSSISGVAEERKPLVIKDTANGFTNGDVYFNTGTLEVPGRIGWLSADGSTYNLNWCTLTNETDYVEGSLWVDQTGIWGNQLLAVTGSGTPAFGSTRGIWRIPAPTNPVQLSRILTPHLESLLTLPNNPTHGPWAGKLITADEDTQLFYTMETNNTLAAFDLKIAADKLLLIPTNEDLYCVLYNGSEAANGMVLKIPKEAFANYGGALLAEQSGEVPQAPIAGARLFVIQWLQPSLTPLIRSISLPGDLGAIGHFEGATFAPILIPPISQ